MAKFELQHVREFISLWDDRKSGGTYNASFFSPIPPPGYYRLGDYGQSDHNAAAGSMIVIKALEKGVLAHPEDYKLLWDDRGTGSSLKRQMRYARRYAAIHCSCTLSYAGLSRTSA